MIHPDDPILQTISSAQLEQLLLRLGWQRLSFANSKIKAFSGPFSDTAGDSLELAFPALNTYADFRRSAADVLNTLAEISNVDPRLLLNEVIGKIRAALTARLFSLDKGDLRSVSLEIAAGCISEMKATMSYAAMLTHQAKPFFAKTSEFGSRFARECRFCHTQEGSFKFIIETPPIIDEVAATETPAVGTGLTKRVVSRLVTGFEQIEAAVANNNTAAMESGYGSGFNANICASLAKISEHVTGMGVELFVIPSTGAIATALAKSSPRLILTERVVETLRYVDEKLRSTTVSPKRWHKGKVVEIKSSFAIGDEARNHSITLRTATGVQLHLHADDKNHAIALQANKDNAFVWVEAEVEKRGKFYHLLDHSDLTRSAPNDDYLREDDIPF